jgi:acylphosphatase
VRNLLDGRVEAELEGDDEAVGRVIGWCRRGPPGSDVDGIEVRWLEPTGTDAEFTIGHTPIE